MMRGRVEEGVLLGPLTTLGVGGPAELLVEPRSPRDLLLALDFFSREGVPTFFLGGGSNVLLPDEGLPGAVVRLTSQAWAVFRDPGAVVGAGYPLGRLCRETVRRGLGGLEKLGGIPGTVGGAVFMNAGVPGAQVGDVVEKVLLWGPGRGPGWVGQKEMEFGYRYSRLQKEGLLVLAVSMRLLPRERGELERTYEETLARRRETQPLGFPSAGSVFRNPPGDFAGRLLDRAGVKGLRRGGAEVSSRHANFILNRGGARAEDVLGLMAEMRRRVKEGFGVELEPEICLVGSVAETWKEMADP